LIFIHQSLALWSKWKSFGYILWLRALYIYWFYNDGFATNLVFEDFGGFSKFEDQEACFLPFDLERNVINLWYEPIEKAWSVNTLKRLVVLRNRYHNHWRLSYPLSRLRKRNFDVNIIGNYLILVKKKHAFVWIHSCLFLKTITLYSFIKKCQLNQPRI